MKDTINKIKMKLLNFYNSKTPTDIEYGVAIFIAFIMLITYFYNDLKSLTVWSTNMLDVLYDMDIKNYFAYTALNLQNVPHQFVSGTIFNFIPWAIWNIPIWILQRFFGVAIPISPLSMIWSKLFLVLCLVLTLYYAYKIVMLLTADKVRAKWVVFLSLTSFYTYVGVFYAGQTDIMICLLGTLAIYNLIKKNDKLFLLCASFAISIKYFFLFPYIAIVLLTEKNIWKIVKKLFIGILPIIICSLLCSNLPMYAESSLANPINFMLQQLINPTTIIMNNNRISLFILGLFVTYFIAYIIVPKDKIEKNKLIIYFTVVPITLMFMFTTYQHYRLILLMPFLLILMSLNKKNWHLNIILETIICIATAFMMINIDQGYFFSITNSMKNGLLPGIFRISSFNDFSISNIITAIPNYSLYSSVMGTFVIGGFIILLIINFPRFKDNLIEVKEKLNVRWLTWIRMLLIVPFILCTIIKLFR